MSILEKFGNGKIKTVATEEGWVDSKGKLLASSVNLLTNRVINGFATDEELARWGEIHLEKLNLRKDSVSATREKNKNRLSNLKEKFDAETKQLKEDSETNISSRIAYLEKQIVFAKLESEYVKADEKSEKEFSALVVKENRIKERLLKVSKSSVKEETLEPSENLSPSVSNEEISNEETPAKVEPTKNKSSKSKKKAV